MAAREPHVEIDLAGKCLRDEGFDIFANNLIEGIQYRDNNHPTGVVKLTELSLKDNHLTVVSMAKLAKVIILSGGTLTQLDISDNAIHVGSSSERAIWKEFLESFQGCYVLKKIDFSGNRLGSAGFDVLSRVYAKSDVDFIESAEIEDGYPNTANVKAQKQLRNSLNAMHSSTIKKNTKPAVNYRTATLQVEARYPVGQGTNPGSNDLPRGLM
jgi:Ran GTPase-activating protein (RanGAP) involved in mRNA processing and transport